MAVLLALIGATACNAILGNEDVTLGSRDASTASGGSGTGGSGAGGTGGASASGGTGGSACPSGSDPGKHGPAMAQMRRPDGTCFWIDTTEVTVSEYAEFLGASHPPQEAACAWNTPSTDGGTPASGETPGFDPPANCISALTGVDAGDPDLPRTCVDWCDAYAYCLWAGKDLCRDDGIALADPAKSDFVQACTAGDSTHLYGCACSSSTVCNGASSGNGVLLPVGKTTGCAVLADDGTTDVYDLSGNAAEWTNTCTPDTETGNCETRGGSFASSDSKIACTAGAPTVRSATQPTLGFRCCVK